MALYGFTADYCSGVVAPALPILAHQIVPPKTLPELSKLVSVSVTVRKPRTDGINSHILQVNVLMFGLANVIWVPLANIFGRRPILLTSLLVFTLTSMWCGLATSFDSLLAARAMQGLAGGTSYTIAPDVSKIATQDLRLLMMC